MVTDGCNGCGQCVPACPYGVISVDKLTKKAALCDLCGGDPMCARHCPFGAVVYVDPEKATLFKRVGRALAIGRQDPEEMKWALHYPLPT